MRFMVFAAGLLLAGVWPTAAWAQVGATTVQLPTFGVSIDAAGVLTVQAFEDPTGQLQRAKIAAAQAALPADLARPSPLRKISLRRLEQALAKQLAAQAPPGEALRGLAGLTRIEAVFYFPAQDGRPGDIVLAGPAEGFAPDLAGRLRGLTTGLPIIELADLATALRAFPAGGRPPGMVGCTIDPTPEGLAKLQEFQRKMPKVVREDQRPQVAQWTADGLEKSLGMAKIRVFGVPADTHFAEVLVEADYRMKRIGMGLERTPIELASYLELLGPSGVMGTLQRWWFVPHYQCLRMSPERDALQFVGQGVQLLAEDKVLAGGKLDPAARPNKASDLFTQGFTKKYPALAAKSPVYAQMRSLIDLSVAAAFIQQERFAQKLGWDLGVLADEARFAVRGRTAAVETKCPSLAVWKGSRLTALAGGGVQINAEQALLPDNVLPDDKGELPKLRSGVELPAGDAWWWD